MMARINTVAKGTKLPLPKRLCKALDSLEHCRSMPLCSAFSPETSVLSDALAGIFNSEVPSASVSDFRCGGITVFWHQRVKMSKLVGIASKECGIPVEARGEKVRFFHWHLIAMG
jgi:hypothetical protein